jgi:hypothetical protein
MTHTPTGGFRMAQKRQRADRGFRRKQTQAIEGIESFQDPNERFDA